MGRPKNTGGRREKSVFRYFVARGAAILLLVSILGALSALSLHGLIADERKLSGSHLPIFQTAARLSANSSILVSLSARQVAAETRAEMLTLSDRVADRARMVREDIDRLAELGLEPADLTRVRDTQTAVLDSALRLDGLLREIAARRRDGGEPAQLAPLLRQRSQLLQRQEQLASEMTTLVSALAQDTSSRVTEHQARAADQARLMLIIVIGASLLTAGAVLAVYRGLRHHVLDRLQALTGALTEWKAGRRPAIATDGPNDEITRMSRILLDLMDAVDQRTDELVEQAITDPLTGLLNRRGMQARGDREVALSHRYGTPLAVLVGDLDHFKRINDSFGHAAGDAELRRIAHLWRELLRDVDLCGRLGGEEFAALLPHTTGEAARHVAERIRQAVGAAVAGDSPTACTISIGVAELEPGEGLAGVLARADLALYDAKRGGRNRVASADHAPAV